MQLSRALSIPIALAIAALACGSEPAPPSAKILTPGASASALVSATTGGSVAAGDLVLEIPPGALEKDTTITVTQTGAPEDAAFALEPNGLTFKIPAIAHYKIPAALAAKIPADAAVAGIRGLFDDEGTKAEYAATEPDGIDGLRAPVPHFTHVTFDVLLTDSVQVTVLTPSPIEANVGEEFGITAEYKRKSDDIVVTWHLGLSENEAGRATIPGVSVSTVEVGSLAMLHSIVDTSPKTDPNDLARTTQLPQAVPLAKKDEATINGGVFQCIAVGAGSARTWVAMTVSGSVVVPNLRIKRNPGADGRYELKGEGGQTTLNLELRFLPATPFLPVTCNAKAAMMNQLGLVAQDREKIPARRRARTSRRYPDSAKKGYHEPTSGTAIGAAQDPLFTLGPGAAARWTAQFPCGDGPVGKTVCGTPGPFTPGDWVMLVSDFDAPIPLADPTWRYQHAFVFDADGITSNNYVPPSQYPQDFFAGSDKWFQLFYEPGKGWSVKVVDARISNTNPVPSAARFVIAGRELAIFVPRSELNGAAPTFRATTFRHQGDYGLNGGPIDLSYWPLLDEPLAPTVVGNAIVVPE